MELDGALGMCEAVLAMSRDPRSMLTPEQRVIFDLFAADPAAAPAGAIPPPVLNALEKRLRPQAATPVDETDGFLRRRELPAGDLLCAADAAIFLGVSLSTFVRSTEKAVERVVVEGRTLYRRAELAVWNEQRFVNRKRKPPKLR